MSKYWGDVMLSNISCPSVICEAMTGELGSVISMMVIASPYVLVTTAYVPDSMVVAFI